jgi:hypothetical protein
VNYLLSVRLPSARQPSCEPSDYKSVADGYCPHEVMLGSKRPQNSEHDGADDQHESGLAPK